MEEQDSPDRDGNEIGQGQDKYVIVLRVIHYFPYRTILYYQLGGMRTPQDELG